VSAEDIVNIAFRFSFLQTGAREHSLIRFGGANPRFFKSGVKRAAQYQP